MAAEIGFGLLESFTPLFSFLLVFVVVYALLEKTRVMGENRGLHSMIALCIALIIIISPAVNQIIVETTPWFVLLFVFLMFLLMGVKFMGISEEDFITTMGGATASWWLVAISLIILLGVAGQIFGPKLLAITAGGGEEVPTTTGGTGTASYSTNLGNTIFHPQFLGMVAVLIIAAFTIKTLAVGPPPTS